MEPIRKKHLTPTQFPFSLVYKDTKSPRDELPDHVHDWYEIVYVYKGSGTFFIDRASYDMNEGDLFLIPGNTIHRAIPDTQDPITSSAIFFSQALIYHLSFGDSFSYLSAFERNKRTGDYKMTLGGKKEQVVELILQMKRELTEEKIGTKYAVVNILHELLLKIGRIQNQTKKESVSVNTLSPSWMKGILEYIDEQLTNDLRLTVLADQALVTPPHFSRIFKKVTGMNLTEYINIKRLLKAKELLSETDYKVFYVAELCGFESVPHFYRTFKKYTGISPAVYRKKV